MWSIAEATGWQEQEVMLGQGQEENKHTAGQGQKTPENPNMVIQGCQEAKGASQHAQTSRLTRQI